MKDIQMNENKIQYFIDYWKDLTHPTNSIEKQLRHTILYNPKEFFKEFRDEIQRKNLSNSDNKKFFINKTNEFSNLDLEALNFIKPTLVLIKQQFSKKDDYSFLLHLLDMLIVQLSNFELGKESVYELIKIITDESDLDKVKTKHLTNLIIFEFIHRKFSQNKIQKMIDEIFYDYNILPDGIIISAFPHNIKCKNYDTNSNEYKAYHNKLKIFIDNLTVEKRIKSLSNYFDSEIKEVRYVFHVRGLKGDHININIGNVQIYNPKFIQLFKKPSKFFNEFFDSKFEDVDFDDKMVYCNGSVAIKTIDYEYSKQEALEILNKALDIVSSRYRSLSIPIAMKNLSFYIISKDGKDLMTSLGGVADKYESYHLNSMEIKNEDYQSEVDFYSNKTLDFNLLPIDKKILKSMHWKRKANEAIASNEKILWQWIAIENLLNNPKTIFDVLSKILAKQQIYTFAWNHFEKVRNLASIQESNNNEKINLTDNLKNKLGLNDSGALYLKKFIDNIRELKDNLDENTLLYDEIINLENIYINKKDCLELLVSFEKIVFEKLVYIYRMRNEIVHNANNEKNSLSDFYVDFITEVSGITIDQFWKKRYSLELKTNDEVIHNLIYEYEKFKLELKENGTDILFQEDKRD